MDRNARIVTAVVTLVAVAITVYLTWNPRGMPRYGGWLFHNLDTVQRDSALFDVGKAFADIVERQDTIALADAGLSRLHLAELSRTGFEITATEITSVPGSTAYDAIAFLRPYWLSDPLHAVVRAGGQLLGGVETLEDIPRSSVETIRLEFAVTEPHWIIQVFFR